MSMRRFLHDESGVAVLEFAILATLLLFLVFGTIDLGRALHSANGLTSAAREGARYSAVLPNPGGSTAAIKTRVKDTWAAYNKLGGVALNDGMIVINCQPNANCNTTSLQSIQVQVNYPFQWYTGLYRLMGWPQNRTLRANATFRWEGS